MPEGPFGFGRITSVGPFSSDRTDIEVVTEETNRSNKPPELVELIEQAGWNVEEHSNYIRRITITQEPEPTCIDVIDQLNKEFSELGERVAHVSYHVINNEIGYTSRTEVDKRIRRMGVATQLRSQVYDHMRELGVDRVYSLPATRKGLYLLKSEGYERSGYGDMLVKEL